MTQKYEFERRCRCSGELFHNQSSFVAWAECRSCEDSYRIAELESMPNFLIKDR